MGIFWAHSGAIGCIVLTLYPLMATIVAIWSN